MAAEQNLNTLQDLLDYEVSRFVSVETELKNALPSWIEITGSEKLRHVLQRYETLVQEHIQKLQDFPQKEKVEPSPGRQRVMQAYLQEAAEKLASCGDGEVKDACLLACIQEINHFKISAYGTATAYANGLRMPAQAQVFHELEVNEKQIDDRLSQLAEFEINLKAQMPHEQHP